MQTYTKEELWKLYQKLPQELKEAVFSSETSDSIWKICERYDIDELSKVGELVENVLLGILPPDNFAKAAEEELGLDSETARKVFQEAHRLIFYPVQLELAKLYPTSAIFSGSLPAASPMKSAGTPKGPTEQNMQAQPETPTNEPTKKQEEDIYREAIE